MIVTRRSWEGLRGGSVPPVSPGASAEEPFLDPPEAEGELLMELGSGEGSRYSERRGENDVKYSSCKKSQFPTFVINR